MCGDVRVKSPVKVTVQVDHRHVDHRHDRSSLDLFGLERVVANPATTNIWADEWQALLRQLQHLCSGSDCARHWQSGRNKAAIRLRPAS